MAISFWWLAAIAAASVAAGFCMGRLTVLQGGEGTEKDGRQRQARREQRTAGFLLSVGSPVSGQVSDKREGNRPAVVIRPGEDKLYAPAAGKVTKIFPMGNAFFFRTDSGAEMYIRVGDSEDELLERFFRPRVVQNEIVSRGKLLLEFDRKGLASAGADCSVTVSLETGSGWGDILAVTGEQIRAGEEFLYLNSQNAEAYMAEA